ncbi:UDP-N-acetylmuramoyl-L-alanine--D-glutamate ligase, partial [Vibrio parahaemolyticus]|nr:UDP-N-acetylmuramoyl-L-alanine--D-glutamate ligase [Vibrio parahaemolyticus]
YQGMSDYRQAKLRIFNHAALAVVNRDDQETFPDAEMPLVTFGSDNQGLGLEVDGNPTWLLDHGQRVVASDELKLVGKHNLSNALVALALLKAADVNYHNALNAL